MRVAHRDGGEGSLTGEREDSLTGEREAELYATKIESLGVPFSYKHGNFKKRKLKVHLIIDALSQRWKSQAQRRKSQAVLPSLEISSEKCSIPVNGEEGEDNFCITVALVENLRDPIQLDFVQGWFIPFLLGTAIKPYHKAYEKLDDLVKQIFLIFSFLEITKVDILWSDRSKVPKSDSSSGELHLRVSLSRDCGSGRFWSTLVNHCLPCMIYQA
ncbi:hypothetical protein K1719_030953 [Acacia pycnantha]|nr:hypothetical protein K1719_030953 [Acacia pycnantha]